MVRNRYPLTLRSSSNEQGFTLVELLVTILVLGLVLSSLGGLYYVLQIDEVQSQHYDIAVRAARTEIEDLRNAGYDNLTPGSNINFTSSLPSQLPHGATGSVAISEPATGLRRVDVTISYSDYGKSRVVTLSSDIGIIGLGQG
ncbi:MAG TPA: prepilin-type N-terminal cleavage/methylation domain-containing protein [Candidatus Saccharimonadales bacterium]|nr:prepilin-type N-terminal cleavage/methylation domain-containing protein [Candidatus Saccharimonadales bacterium]